MSRHAAAAVALVCLAAAAPAGADGRLGPRTPLPAYAQECAACHTAYPPGLLPAGSWQRVMTGLTQHYGTDASLDAALVQEIGSWLRANAGTDKRVREAPPQDRITRAAWFERKHRGIEPAVWALDSVRSAAQCTACHPGAERGDFDDDTLKRPAGLDARLQRPWQD